jgi:O-antigen/teichoic acid export membrane protein
MRAVADEVGFQHLRSMTASETMLRPILPPGDLERDASVDHAAELKRGAWANLIAMLASNFRGIFTFLVARLLGPAALGIFSVAWATTDLVSKIGIFGLDGTIITFIARAEATGDRARSRSLFHLAVFLGLLQCAILAGISITFVRVFGRPLGLDPQMVAALSVMF